MTSTATGRCWVAVVATPCVSKRGTIRSSNGNVDGDRCRSPLHVILLQGHIATDGNCRQPRHHHRHRRSKRRTIRSAPVETGGRRVAWGLNDTLTTRPPCCENGEVLVVGVRVSRPNCIIRQQERGRQPARSPSIEWFTPHGDVIAQRAGARW